MNIQGIHSNLIPMAATSAGSSNSTSSTNSSSPTSSNSSAVGSSNQQLTQSDFLKLIATELQAQDPTNPLDPSQFMGQLVQFNTLDEVTGIYNILAQGAAASGATGATAAAGSATGASTSSAANSTSTSPATLGL